MNQILYEDTGDKKPVEIKKILLFFSIALIIFGIALVAVGIVQLTKSNAPVSTNKPVISVEKFDETQVVLSVTHDKTIDKIVYNWNGAKDEVVEGANRKYIERLEEIPVLGENVLNVYVKDTTGIEATYTGTFSLENSSKGPKITLGQIEKDGKKRISIYAEDDTEISYLTYRWNNSDETTVKDTDISNTIIQTDIEIPSDLPSGENQLIVVAVDASNNQTKEVKEIKIARKPVIAIPVQNKSKLRIKVTDEVGLDYVQYILNGKSYTWRSNADGIKECETTIDLQPGENTITIKARNKEGIDANTFYGKCVYTVD